MANEEEIQNQQKLLAAHRQTLAHYLYQRAQLGSAYEPPGISNGISEARENITRIKRVLRTWGEVVEDQPDDESPDIPRHPRFPTVRQLLSVGVIVLVLVLSVIVWIIMQMRAGLDGSTAPSSTPIIPNLSNKTIGIAFQTLDSIPPQPDLSLAERVARTQRIADWIKEQIVKNPEVGTESFGVLGPKDIEGTHLSTTNLPQFAQEISATMVVYGSVDEVDGQGMLNIRLYISDTKIADAEELLGDYYLGSAIRYVAPLDSGAIEDTNQEIRRRLQVATALLFGLHELLKPADRFDSKRAQDRFDEALKLIQETTDPPSTTEIPCPPSSLSPTQAEVVPNSLAQSTILVLKGNTALRAKDYDTAHDFYTQAIKLSCDNARPYLGLAITTIRQANLKLSATPSQQELDQYTAALDQASQYFTLAQEATRKPESALFRERLLYNQGLWHLSRAGLADTIADDTKTRAELAAARDSFSAVIEAYDLRSPEYRQSRVFTTLVASSLADRSQAVSNLDTQAVPQAVADYQRAIELEDSTLGEHDPERRAGWSYRIGHLQTILGSCAAAQDAYQQALDFGPSDRLRQQIQMNLKRLPQDCTPQNR